MTENKTVLIVVLEGCCEGEAVRQTLENFGYIVVNYGIGRPQHLIDILAGKTIMPFDYIIFSCHGDDDGMVMVELGEDIYTPDEPRGNFGPNEINKYLALKDTCIINMGCSTGREDLAKAFAKNGNTYLAPKDDIGNGFMFVALFFYYLSEHGLSATEAHQKAAALDEETGLYGLWK